MRAIVSAASGVTEAAELLGLDPKTVRQRERGTSGIVMVVYRGTNTEKVDDKGRLFGETGQGEDSAAQLRADSEWFAVAQDKRETLRAVVYVVEGKVARVREIEDGEWREEEGKVALPVGPALSPAEVRQMFPTLPFNVDSPRPMVRGKIREYIAL
ncbi:hypothetical protein [Streptomyces hyaluromycini]|uniref:hypothetical protein n=1 Tax=Streptomyces hyaluromycini TaxID=1377993 RepID=UPI0011AE5EFA|nr:hypothetical protein [Streptomyces hyaluromycini]